MTLAAVTGWSKISAGIFGADAKRLSARPVLPVTMKQDRYFKFAAAVILVGVILAFFNPGHAQAEAEAQAAAAASAASALNP